MLQSCAAMAAHRDSVPEYPRAYRRILRLEFCSGTLTPAALSSWMHDAADAVDSTFTGFARR